LRLEKRLAALTGKLAALTLHAGRLDEPTGRQGTQDRALRRRDAISPQRHPDL
jgi:hypothetical protein